MFHSLSLLWAAFETTVEVLFCELFTRQILDSSKVKEFADNNFKSDENRSKLSKQVENIVGKGEICSL